VRHLISNDLRLSEPTLPLMLRKLALRLRDEERGIALIIALGVIVVLSIAMASAIDYSSAPGVFEP